ncbi:TorF family putative porin [Sphingomonas montana]|uniref:TorF family putative porin n=1 Tax=Sphingomonas montana TaxID=1843236 RepID=UPI00096FF066|nr:TorF family putative porin [Sphingomonas montana]
MNAFRFAAFAVLAGVAVPAAAQDAAPSPITINGAAAIVSDYRFRGVSQSDKDMAVQAGLTVSHASGLYVGAWGSNLSGWGTFGGSNMELDLIGGYKHKLGDSATIDVGLVWYMYPGGASKTDFAEPYAKLTGTAGAATLTASVAYAPKQQALGRWYATGTDAAAGVYTDAGDKEDNLYLAGDGAVALTGTPITAKAHIGHSWGNDGLGPNATSVTPTGDYWDWAVGADATYRNLTLNVSYVDTDISRRDAAYLQPSFSKGQDGTGSIADGTIVLSLTTAF